MTMMRHDAGTGQLRGRLQYAASHALLPICHNEDQACVHSAACAAAAAQCHLMCSRARHLILQLRCAARWHVITMSAALLTLVTLDTCCGAPNGTTWQSLLTMVCKT